MLCANAHRVSTSSVSDTLIRYERNSLYQYLSALDLKNMASMCNTTVRRCRFRLECSASKAIRARTLSVSTMIERAQPVLPISVGFDCGDYMVPMSN